MLERERAIALDGSIQIMNKNARRGDCHCALRHFNYSRFASDLDAHVPEALRIPVGACVTAKIMVFATFTADMCDVNAAAEYTLEWYTRMFLSVMAEK